VGRVGRVTSGGIAGVASAARRRWRLPRRLPHVRRRRPRRLLHVVAHRQNETEGIRSAAAEEDEQPIVNKDQACRGVGAGESVSMDP
jgi:hypothetical protein